MMGASLEKSSVPTPAEQKRLLLAQMLRKQASQPKVRPLSMGQERLWLLTRMDPDSPVYNIAVAYHLTGPIDMQALGQALEAIARRHDTLRTTFEARDGQPMQRIGQEVVSNLSIVDLQHVPEPERAREAQKLAAEEGRMPFDLGKGPLWRAKLLRCSDQSNVLVLTMHHIISDGWSFALLCQKLGTFYTGIVAGAAVTLPDLPIQYAEFSQKEREAISGATFQEHQAFWRKQFQGNVATLQLPSDSADGIAPTHRGVREPFALSPELSKALVELSQREKATLFMTLLAGFEAVLHQYSQQQDMVVCTPVSGRNRSDSRQLIGYFNNILPLRCDLRNDPTLLDLVRRTRQVALDSYKYQGFPFLSIMDSPGLSQVSLSRVLFSLDMPWPPKLALGDLSCEGNDLFTDTSDFDLSVSIWEQDGQLLGAIKYKADLFERKTVAELISRFRTSLELLTTDPDLRLSALPQTPKPRPKPSSGTGDRGSAGYVGPRTPSELRVTKVWEEVLGKQPIGVRDDLLSMGASSLVIARLAEGMQSTFNIRLPIATFFQARTVEQLTALLESSDGGLPTSSLAPIQPRGSLPPLFLCEGVDIYLALAGRLGTDQPVYGLVTELARDYPEVKDLASQYVAEIRVLQPTGPYYLGGVSFGGLVAFEMAQQLIAAGEKIGLLLLLDTPTPWAYTPKFLPGRLVGHLRNLRKFGFAYLKKTARIRLQKIRRGGGGQNRPAGAVVRRIARTEEIRELFEVMAAKYQLKKYPERLTLFALAHRDGMSDCLFDPALGAVDPLLGWGRIADGGVDRHEMAGEHVSMLKEPHVEHLAETLKCCLKNARG